MKYHIAKVKTTFFKFFKRVGDVGDDTVYSIKKTFNRSIESEKTKLAMRKISRTSEKIISNMKENARNWGSRIDSGDNFRIHHDDV